MAAPYLHGNGHRVTWAVGHLVALPQPDQINGAWKLWRADRLPMLPDRWPLRVVERTREQFDVVARLINDRDAKQIICATDAGREGELIFRYIHEAAGCNKSFRRLWISSLTPEAIRDGLAHLKDGAQFDPLAAAARGRSRADWLVGMNLSRAYALAYDDRFSVGRVQTPTLAMLVQRDQSIDAFVAEDYLEVHASFRTDADYPGTYVGADSKPRRLPADGEEAERIVARAKAGAAEIRSVKRRTRRLRPPTLYDLTELQRHATTAGTSPPPSPRRCPM